MGKCDVLNARLHRETPAFFFLIQVIMDERLFEQSWALAAPGPTRCSKSSGDLIHWRHIDRRYATRRNPFWKGGGNGDVALPETETGHRLIVRTDHHCRVV
jgi:hypothetical protein